jgi:hypothetical protein
MRLFSKIKMIEKDHDLYIIMPHKFCWRFMTFFMHTISLQHLTTMPGRMKKEMMSNKNGIPF